MGLEKSEIFRSLIEMLRYSARRQNTTNVYQHLKNRSVFGSLQVLKERKREKEESI